MNPATSAPAPSEDMLPVAEVVAVVGGSVNSIARYIRIGHRLPNGTILKLRPAQVRFNKLMTSVAAVERFIAAIQPSDLAESTGEPMELPGVRKRNAAAAKKGLRERHGVNV